MGYISYLVLLMGILMVIGKLYYRDQNYTWHIIVFVISILCVLYLFKKKISRWEIITDPNDINMVEIYTND